MTTMKVLAQAGDYKLILELNGTIVLEVGRGLYLCDTQSAYETIKLNVPEPERAAMLKQLVKGGRS